MIHTVSAVALPRAGADAPPTRGQRRDVALDFTKGVLVMTMVVYHWFNYFISVEGDFYRYLRFLTPSFIFITGYLVSQVYLPRRDAGDASVYRRLLQRGLKVLFLFTVLNFGASLLVTQNYNGARLGVSTFVENAYAIYVRGDGAAIFDVLVPIAYFLMIAPALVFVGTHSRRFLYAICSVTVAGALIASQVGRVNTNLELLSFAVLGMAVGALRALGVDRALDRPFAIATAYAIYLWALIRWDVIFPVQLLGVCSSLAIIHFVGLRSHERRPIDKVIIELGRYSLFAYIVQVLVLQVLRRLLGFADAAAVATGLLAAVLLTVLAVQTAAAVRRSSPGLDRTYRLVFG
jgi:peptidoglycan/LPS O-acetylase OafA/YrhL